MTDTAIIVCPQDGIPEAGLLPLRLAGLPLLARALLTAQHAGLARLWVVGSPAQRRAMEPELLADCRLAGHVSWHEPEEPLPALALVLSPLVIVAAGALRAWLQAPATSSILMPEESEGGPVLARGPALAACVRAMRRGPLALSAYLLEAWDEGHVAFRRWPAPRPEAVTSAAAVPAAERALLRALRTPEDGPIVDRFVNRTLSGGLSRWLARGPITPNQVTVASLLTGLAAAWLLGRSGSGAALAGLALFQLSAVLDHSDGELARLRFQFSRFGKWLDNWSDHAVDLAVVTGVTWRAAASSALGGLVPLAILAGVGITGSFLAAFVWTLRREEQAGGRPAGRHPLLGMANRDGFCLALWATILAGRPALLLWLLAVGANAFWLLWIVMLPSCRPRPDAGR